MAYYPITHIIYTRLVVLYTACTLVTVRSIQECAYYIILLCSSCMHYAMGSALQNDVKTTHQLMYTYITFTVGFSQGILQLIFL